MTAAAKSIREAAQAAADWWAQQVGAPTFRNTDQSDTPRDRNLGGMAAVMQTMVAARHDVSKETSAAFVATLAKRIEKDLRRATDYGVWLSVDYGPCIELAEVAAATGVSLSRFPWKTSMRVRADYVTASLGYRSPDRLIWSAPGWERPTCLAYRYEGEQSFDERCSLPLYHEGEHGDWLADSSTCEGCGLGYTGHYDRRDGDFHSWKPVQS